MTEPIDPIPALLEQADLYLRRCYAFGGGQIPGPRESAIIVEQLTAALRRAFLLLNQANTAQIKQLAGGPTDEVARIEQAIRAIQAKVHGYPRTEDEAAFLRQILSAVVDATREDILGPPSRASRRLDGGPTP